MIILRKAVKGVPFLDRMPHPLLLLSGEAPAFAEDSVFIFYGHHYRLPSGAGERFLHICYIFMLGGAEITFFLMGLTGEEVKNMKGGRIRI